ncbi:MAG: prepilin-type N-terminal cleavage/methylation domain-containing protein [Chromatiales bacterium]|nr:prepilin-type N-terminal cleavage/methylation domain-containing protein [Chromatiales bacterium]
MRASRARGFTLIEMIMTLVVLAILGTVLAPVIGNAIQSLSENRARTDLISTGRLALERLARELREAVPNSITILAAGGGIEFLHSRSGGRYIALEDQLPGGAFSLSARRFAKNHLSSELYSALPPLALSGGELLVLGNGTPLELRSGVSSVSLNSVIATALVSDGTTEGSVLQFAPHLFPNDSPGKHYFVTDGGHDVGLSGSTLYWHRYNGLSDYNGAADWNSGSAILLEGVNSILFDYAPGVGHSAGIVRIQLQISHPQRTDETITLYHEVHLRNRT